jgi:hypothetical protein
MKIRQLEYNIQISTLENVAPNPGRKNRPARIFFTTTTDQAGGPTTGTGTITPALPDDLKKALSDWATAELTKAGKLGAEALAALKEAEEAAKKLLEAKKPAEEKPAA